MYNQNRGAVVAATRPCTTARGVAFDGAVRAVIAAAAHSCRRIPDPAPLFHDIARGRPASLTRIGDALAALADDPSLPAHAIDDLFASLAALVRSWRPTVTPCIDTAWRAETVAQADADVAQADALIGRDRVSLQRAIDRTAANLSAQQALLASLQRALSELDAPPRYRVTFRRGVAATGRE